MKLLFLNVLDDPADGGGAEVTIWNLMRALVKRGHECVLLATGKERGLSNVSRDGVKIWRAGIRNTYWPGDRTPRSSAEKFRWHGNDIYNRRMAKYLRDLVALEKPDIVSMHNLAGWSSAVWPEARRAGVPAVQVLHDQYSLCPKSSMFNGGRNCERQCASCRLFRLPHASLSSSIDAVVGVSQFILDRHLDYGLFKNADERRVIHNARVPEFLGLDEPRLASNAKGLRVGFIGRLDPAKGIDCLLEAFRSVQSPEAELWIAGRDDDDYAARLKAEVTDARVKFLGRMKPKDFYPFVDVVVVPSLWHDTFPGVVFEAFAFGKPVIGSRRGGIPEMIKDHVNGMLFDPGEPAQLTACLEQLTSEDGLRMRLASRALADSKRFLDVDVWVDEYLGVYETLVNGGKRKRRAGVETAGVRHGA